MRGVFIYFQNTTGIRGKGETMLEPIALGSGGGIGGGIHAAVLFRFFFFSSQSSTATAGRV